MTPTFEKGRNDDDKQKRRFFWRLASASSTGPISLFYFAWHINCRPGKRLTRTTSTFLTSFRIPSPGRTSPTPPSVNGESLISFSFFFGPPSPQPKQNIHMPFFTLPTNKKSQVEETIERIKMKSGIEGYVFVPCLVFCGASFCSLPHNIIPRRYVITNKKGQVLRRFHTMSEEKTEAMAATMRQLAVKAQNVARDLDPSVRLVCVCVSSGYAGSQPTPFVSPHCSPPSFHRRTRCSTCASRQRNTK